MRTWQVSDEDVEVDLTPMIDVVFLLIAFFMTLISFLSAEQIELKLAESTESTVAKESSGRQFVSISKDGTLYFGATRISYEELPGLLAERRLENPEVQVFLRADSATPHRHVNRVISATGRAGIFDIIFAAERTAP